MLNLLKAVFASFQKHNVKYVVISGVAAVLHGVPRATFDLDILIESSLENARHLLKALEEARFGTAALLEADELLAHEITIFKDVVRIDVQTSTPGLTFADAWKERQRTVFEGQEFFIASRKHLIASKRAAGREIDLEDIRLLEAGNASPG